ncbi:MAG: SusC/RagA family TonB-linked outer membrane protein [Chitinophagaceae bacterium]|nr:MAG: SusC/RagA family TonB-linked outer membrane protein [Chitinophagaceae bacterium]
MMREEAFKNDGVIPNVNNAPDLLVWDTTRYTNFEKLLIGGTAHTTNAQASISGGNEQTQFLLSGGYNHQTTVLPGNLADNRGSFHVNVNHRSLNKRFNLAFSAFYVSDNDNINATDITSFINHSPNTPALYDSTGQLNWQQGGVAFDNPLSYLLSAYMAQTNNLMGHLQLSYELLPGLTLKASTGYNTLSLKEINTNPVTSQNPIYNPQGYSQFGNNSFKSWIVEPQMEYIKEAGKLRLDLLLGGTWQQTMNDNSSFFAYGYSNDELLKSISAASSLSVIGDSYSQYRYQASFGRLNLNWANTYILNVSGRRDGSSRFGPGKRFGNFGALGAAWLFSNEKFIKNNLHFLSFGKLRASYGNTGNDQIPDYQYLDSWSSTAYPYDGIAGLYPSRLFNPDYSWEINRKLETAIELGFFKDNLQLSVSYFRNRSSNQLIQYRLPVQTGFTNIISNFPATVQNTGWEITLNSNNITSGVFTWTTAFNLTIPKNKLIAFPGLATSSYSGEYIIGQPLSIIRGYQYLGVNPKTGIFKFRDVNNDGIINFQDYVTLGNLDPKFYGGLNNNFTYKSFGLTIFFEFRKQWGKNYLASVYNPYVYPPGTMGNQPVALLGRWQKPGDKSSLQQFTTTPGTAAYNALNNFVYTSGGIYGDASFIRLKTIALSYSIPQDLLKKAHVASTNIYLQAQNLLTFTHYQGSDPETQNLYALPPLRAITAGIQFTF